MTDKIAAAVTYGDYVIVVSERGRVFKLAVFSPDIFITEMAALPLDAAPAGECQVFEDRDVEDSRG